MVETSKIFLHHVSKSPCVIFAVLVQKNYIIKNSCMQGSYDVVDTSKA